MARRLDVARRLAANLPDGERVKLRTAAGRF